MSSEPAPPIAPLTKTRSKTSGVKPGVAAREAGPLPTYTNEQVAAHNKDADVWIVIHGHVYNVTPFLEDHPGGPEILQNVAGTDATNNFEEVFHSAKARNLLADYCIGKQHGYTGPPDAALHPRSSTGPGSTGGPSNIAVIIIVLGIILAVCYKLFFLGPSDEVVASSAPI